MIQVRTLDDMDIVAARMRKILDSGGVCQVEISKPKKSRTVTQNASLHLYFQQMADAMNDAGYTHRKTWEAMSESFDIPVTALMIKEIAQKVCLDMFGTKHTSKLTTVQMQELYETLSRAFGRSVGIALAWPSVESQNGDAFHR